MTSGFWQRIDLWSQRLWPSTLTLLLMLLGAVPLPLPFWQPINPDFALMAVYYWAIHRPTALPLPLVFLIGILADFFGMAPLGVGTLVLVLTYAVTLSQRRLFIGQPFLVVWWGYMMVSGAAMALAWAVTSLLAVDLVDSRPAIFCYLVDLGLYPGVAYLFARVQRSLLSSA
ncbi:MAG: rod shape-determining protein MreD [Pseudomonadota bacterium]